MKKLLILLMAFLLFAPPRAHAEDLNTLLYGPSATKLGKTTSDGKANTNAYIYHTEGHFCGSDLTNQRGSGAVFHQESNIPISGSSSSLIYYLNALQIGADGTQDKIQMLLDTPTPSSSGNNATAQLGAAKALKLDTNMTLKFRCLYDGKIKKLYIKYYSYSNTQYNDLSITEKWTSDKADIEVVKSTSMVFVTTKNPEGENEFSLSLNNDKLVTIESISVDWTPGEPTIPETPKYITIDGERIEADANGNFTYMLKNTTNPQIVVPLTKATQASMAIEGGTKLTTGFTHTGNTLFLPASTAKNNLVQVNFPNSKSVTALTSKKIRMVPIYSGDYVSVTKPTASKTATTSKVINLRSWNSTYASEPYTITINRPQLKAPVIDTENLSEGCTYDAATNTFLYTKYDGEDYTKSTIIRFKEYYAASRCYYTLNGANPTSSNGTLVDFTKTDFIGVPVFFDVPPVKNQTTRVKVVLNDNNVNSDVTEFFVKYVGGDDEGDGQKILAAPAVSIDENTITAALAGGVTAFTGNDGVKVNLESQMGTEGAKFKYQFTEVWAQNPDNSKWLDWPADGYNVTTTGRLFVQEVKDGYESQTTYRDFSKISATATDLGLSGITDGQVITLKESKGYVITGKYETVMPNSTTGEPSGTKFVYIADEQGRAIKMIIEGNSNEAIFNSYEAGLGLNDITGVVRGIETGLPELWITTSAMDYAPFLPGAAINPEFTADNKTVTEISRADFNKKVVLRGVTFNKADNLFITATGATVKPYARLITTPAFSEITNLNENVTYSVEGFVGNANGDMVLLPTVAIATPKLLAPNPITASAEDESNGYITVNVVSDIVEITPDTKGVRTGTSLKYSINGGEEQTLPEIMTNPAKISIAAADYDAAGKCVLKVHYERENTTGETVEIHLFKRDAVPVASIAEFKEKYPDGTETNDGIYYRYTGNALVRAITPQYLYLRDMPAEGTEFTKDELSAHSILLYNENGWEAKVAMNVRDDEAPRALKTGDIITGFAFKADRTHLQNLRGDATGFARTLRREPATEMEYEPQTKDILTENTPFEKADRMVRFVIKNVYVKQTVIDPDEYDDDLKRHRYTLDMDGAPELNIGDIFVLRKGWSTAYDAGSRYDIDGVVIRNGADDKYAVAMIDFTFSDKTEALSVPVLAIEGEDADATSFLKTAKIVMTSAEGADIYYTTDKSDPRRSSSRVKYSDPLEISATTTIKAFASKPGEIPSDMVEIEFTRAANDRRFIVNFLDQAEAGVPYHFSGTARVAAKGGEYIFVRGTQGHYLPIHIDDPALLAKINEDDYVSDFVMEPHIINTDDAAIVRGAHITADYAPLFSESSATKPSTLTSDIQYEPDVVTTITAANARRYVKIMGVRLIGTGFEAETDDAASHDTEWKLTTDKGEGIDIPVNHNILTPTFNWDEADQTAAAYYNITGFAMLGEDGGIELWPLEVEKVRSSEPVVPSFTGNITVKPVTADGLTTVEFYPYTTVHLECPIADPKSATIYYYVSTDGKTPAADAKWNVYAQDFVITSDSYITMYATAPGYEQSAYTHIDAKLGTPAGTVAFDVTPAPGKTTVKMTAAEGAEIFYTTDNSIAEDQWTRYTDAVEFTDDATMLWAYAKEGVKKGAVSSMYVMVMPEETQKPVDPSDPTDPSEPEQPADRISGRLNFKLTDDGKGAVRVDISPADQLEEGKYEIWYTTKTGVVLPDGGTKYEGAFEMKESGLVMAVLVEKATGKPAGQTCEVAVWVVPTPTAIDSIGADGDDNVKVDGNSIIAPEGSVVYDLTGRRVAATDLRTGIYIVRTPGGKSVKVRVD